jgi:hypothetical protein
MEAKPLDGIIEGGQESPSASPSSAFQNSMLEEAAYWQQARHQQTGERIIQTQAQELIGRRGRMRRSSHDSLSAEGVESGLPADEEEAYWVDALRISADEHSPSSVTGMDENVSARRCVCTPTPPID